MRALFPFLSGVTEIFCKMESRFLNSRMFAGGFVTRYAKMAYIAYIKKGVEKSAVGITKV